MIELYQVEQNILNRFFPVGNQIFWSGAHSSLSKQLQKLNRFLIQIWASGRLATVVRCSFGYGELDWGILQSSAARPERLFEIGKPTPPQKKCRFRFCFSQSKLSTQIIILNPLSPLHCVLVFSTNSRVCAKMFPYLIFVISTTGMIFK